MLKTQFRTILLASMAVLAAPSSWATNPCHSNETYMEVEGYGYVSYHYPTLALCKAHSPSVSELTADARRKAKKDAQLNIQVQCADHRIVKKLSFTGSSYSRCGDSNSSANQFARVGICCANRIESGTCSINHE